MRLAQSQDEQVRGAFQEIHQTWLDLIHRDVPDPAVARAIMLLGDGLYYNAALFGADGAGADGGGADGAGSDEASAGTAGREAADVESLLRVVDVLAGRVTS
jgi:hypothetical protein